MSKRNLNVLFWLYKSRLDKNGEAPLYLRITYQKERKNLSTGFSIPPKCWDAVKGIIKSSLPKANQINSYIAQTRSVISELFNEMAKNQDINLDQLVSNLFGKEEVERTLLHLVRFHNDNFKARVGLDYSYSTFEKYDILRKKLEGFIQNKYQRKDIHLKDLGYQFMSDFDFFLKNNDKNAHNTVTKYLKNLKRIINYGIHHKWLAENPFRSYKSSYKDVERYYLTQSELDMIEAKSFQLKRLSLAKDLFLFQCYTGLAYSDMAKLTAGNISPGVDGNQWIIIRRQKTDVRSAIPLLPKAEELIKKYANVENPTGTLFPVYSIQRFNSYLHEIAHVCGIQKTLTSHVGRRTFATTIALGNGISLETISKILGHSTTKITSQYAVVTDLKISQEMSGLRDKFRKH